VAEKDPVDKICDQIREDGGKEVASILDKARRTAAEITAKAEEEAGKVGERFVAEASEKGELARKRTLSSVSLEVRRIRLKAREEVVTAVMNAVRAEIEQVRTRPDYPKVLAGLVAEAIRALGGEAFVVRADARDIALLESAVFPSVREILRGEGRTVARLEAKEIPGGCSGGVQVGVPKGNVVYDNTFEARLYRLRDEIRATIFQGIFSAGDKID
jgi:vacuolar-type H+-ATPase subunit E/Vma4